MEQFGASGAGGSSPVFESSVKGQDSTLSQGQVATAPNGKIGTWLRGLKASFTSFFSSRRADADSADAASYRTTIKERLTAFGASAKALGGRFVAASGDGLKAVGAFLLTLAEAAGKGTQLLFFGILFAVGSALMGGYTAGKQHQPREGTGKMKDVGARLVAAFEGFKEEGGKGLTAGGKWMQTVCTMAKEAIQARRAAANAADD